MIGVMKAAVLTVGDELVSGEKQDTNFPVLAKRLAVIGIECVLHQSVGDDTIAIARAVKTTQDVARVVVVTGGLGPTSDDVTREGVARALGRELTFNDAVAARLSERFPEADRQFLDVILKQAYAVENAEIVMPKRGTAPGLILFDGDQVLYILPGVPAELEEMLADAVLPDLEKRFPDLVPLRREVLRTAGFLEAEVQKLVGDLETVFGDVSFGLLAHAGLVDLVLAGQESDAADIAAALTEIRSRLGSAVYGTGDEALQQVVGDMLRRSGAKLAIAESCTGGLVSGLITEVAGSSGYFVGGVVAYANDTKSALLDVDPDILAAHGAVSEEVAQQMALGARARLRADLALGITGVAGPGGGTDRAPVGTVFVALAHGGGCACVKRSLHGDRAHVRLAVAHLALDQLRLHLMGTSDAA